MVRLLALIVFFGFAVRTAADLVSLGGARPRGTYRPRPRWRFNGEPHGKAGTVHLVRRSELEGLRDAYSSAPIDPDEPLLRCGRCLAVYDATSAHELERTNGGRCVACGSTDLAPVRIAGG
jgi:hypothetical protein